MGGLIKWLICHLKKWRTMEKKRIELKIKKEKATVFHNQQRFFLEIFDIKSRLSLFSKFLSLIFDLSSLIW